MLKREYKIERNDGKSFGVSTNTPKEMVTYFKYQKHKY